MHESVLAIEAVELLSVRQGGVYVDGTLGSGGHAELILEKTGTSGRLLGIDRDSAAIERSAVRLAKWGDRAILAMGNHADMAEIAAKHGLGLVDGVLLDLGVSSDQFDDGTRGFSFMHDGPLDMRMNREDPVSAGDLVNDLAEEELANVIWRNGEEPASRRIARAIVVERARGRIKTTTQFADIVARACGGRKGPRHPATRTFQALRIAVNGELESLGKGLEAGIGMLKPGGRMAVITFHSLEDRIVKRCFAEHAGRWESLQEGGRKLHITEPAVKLVTGKPVRPSEPETEANPRARSAKLRVVERCDY